MIGAVNLFVVMQGQSFSDAGSVAASGISGTPVGQTAGAAFNLARLVAADRQFNISTAYTGGKTISYSGPGGVTTYTTSVSFTAGQSTTTLVTTLTKAETTTITATDGANPGVPSSSFVVGSGVATKLQILLPGEVAAPGTATGKTAATPTAQTAGTPILNGIVVNAVDANWNVVSSATVDVAITYSDASATIADDNGVAGGNLSLTAGTATLSSLTLRQRGYAHDYRQRRGQHDDQQYQRKRDGHGRDVCEAATAGARRNRGSGHSQR